MKRMCKINDPSTYDRRQVQWKEAEEHFNEVVLFMFDIYRLVGYCEDDSDVYYVLKHPNNANYIRYSMYTGVGSPILLKGRIAERDYTNLDTVLGYNGCPPEPEFILGFPEEWKY